MTRRSEVPQRDRSPEELAAEARKVAAAVARVAAQRANKEEIAAFNRAFDDFGRALCDIKVGDRYQLTQDLMHRPHTQDLMHHPHYGVSYVLAPEGRKGTVKEVTISGLTARVRIRFDGCTKDQWLSPREFKELGALDRLAEI